MLTGNVAYAGCGWAMLCVLAKLGTPTMVGQFVLALAVTTPVLALLMLQLRVVQATDAKNEYQFGDYLALRLATTALAVAVIVGVSLMPGYRYETALVIVAAGVSAAIDSLSDIVYGFLQRHERMDRIAQSMIIKGLLSLAALTAVILATGRLLLGILAIGASRLVVLVTWDLPSAAAVVHGGSLGPPRGPVTHAGLLPRFSVRTMLALARLSLPLGLVMMLIALSGNIPRYYVEHYLGEHSLGIFGALVYLPLVGTMVVRALGQASTPRLALRYASGRTTSFAGLILKLGAIAAAVGATGVAVALLAGPQILTLVYGPEYAEYSYILVWAMVAGAIGYLASISTSGMTAARYLRVQMPLFALVVGATAVACVWLIPWVGLLGAALSLLVAAGTQLIGGGLVIWHALRAKAASYHQSSVVYASADGLR